MKTVTRKLGATNMKPEVSQAHRRELLRFLLTKTAAVRSGIKPAELLRVRHCYKSKNYRTRCATVNILIQIATKDNAGIIVEFSKKVLNKENSKAVISTIYTLINRCDLLMKE